MAGNLIVTVGNSMMGDDGAGPYLATLVAQQGLTDWSLIDGGIAPENVIHQIRAQAPSHLLLIDATEMAEKAGTLKVIEAEQIAEMFIFSTHNMPLNFLIDELKSFVPEVTFIGVQPAIVAFSFPMTTMVQQAMDFLYQQLANPITLQALITAMEEWNLKLSQEEF